jgi:hypothetical protein
MSRYVRLHLSNGDTRHVKMAEGETFDQWTERALGGSGRLGTSEGSVTFMAQLVEFYPVELDQQPEQLEDSVD